MIMVLVVELGREVEVVAAAVLVELGLQVVLGVMAAMHYVF